MSATKPAPEIGLQRRRTSDGRLLHACCICDKLEPWGDTWSTYCSVKELEDCVPIPKFCSTACQAAGGVNAGNVSAAMKTAAKAREWREPEPYSQPPHTYGDALYDQRRRHRRAPPP